MSARSRRSFTRRPDHWNAQKIIRSRRRRRRSSQLSGCSGVGSTDSLTIFDPFMIQIAGVPLLFCLRMLSLWRRRRKCRSPESTSWTAGWRSSVPKSGCPQSSPRRQAAHRCYAKECCCQSLYGKRRLSRRCAIASGLDMPARIAVGQRRFIDRSGAVHQPSRRRAVRKLK